MIETMTERKKPGPKKLPGPRERWTPYQLRKLRFDLAPEFSSISQYDLAMMIGVHSRTVAEWEVEPDRSIGLVYLRILDRILKNAKREARRAQREAGN